VLAQGLTKWSCVACTRVFCGEAVLARQQWTRLDTKLHALVGCGYPCRAGEKTAPRCHVAEKRAPHCEKGTTGVHGVAGLRSTRGLGGVLDDARVQVPAGSTARGLSSSSRVWASRWRSGGTTREVTQWRHEVGRDGSRKQGYMRAVSWRDGEGDGSTQLQKSWR
jgi:hypothetical protein